MSDLASIERRLEKLEKESRIKMVLQYLLFPLMLLGSGALLNREANRRADEVKRFEIAQRMVPMLFAGNADQAFATQRILHRVLDTALVGEIDSVVVKYYRSRITESLRSGNVDSAVALVRTAQAVGGEAAEKLVAPADRPELSRAGRASALERQAFEHLLAGRYDEAQADFARAEQAYPGYHSVYEIARLIRQRRPALASPEAQEELLRTIATRHAYGAPADLLRRVRERVRA